MRLRHLLFPAILVFASHAYAADIGECATPEAMTAKLKSEDQHSVASAQMITPDKQLFGMIFTMSGDRTVGYILKADQPLGDRAGQICIYNRMADVRLFDARKPGLASDTLLKTPDADALKRCDELAAQGKIPRPSCGAYNVVVRKGAAAGNMIVLQALGVQKDGGGIYRPAASLITVSGNVTGTLHDDPKNPARGIIGDVMYSSLPDGATILNATLVFVTYTDYGLAALK